MNGEPVLFLINWPAIICVDNWYGDCTNGRLIRETKIWDPKRGCCVTRVTVAITEEFLPVSGIFQLTVARLPALDSTIPIHALWIPTSSSFLPQLGQIGLTHLNKSYAVHYVAVLHVLASDWPRSCKWPSDLHTRKRLKTMKLKWRHRQRPPAS